MSAWQAGSAHGRRRRCCRAAAPHPPSSQARLHPCSPLPAPALQLAADWRAFRARLVAMEQGQADLAAQMHLRPDARWAHTITAPERGALLVAKKANLGMFTQVHPAPLPLPWSWCRRAARFPDTLLPKPRRRCPNTLPRRRRRAWCLCWSMRTARAPQALSSTCPPRC